MNEKINSNCYYKNIKNEFDKKDNKKILYNNLVKTSQKSNSKISIFNKNKSNNKNNKKENSINMKLKENITTNLKKPISIKKDKTKEKKEKPINTNSCNENLKTKNNNLNEKKQIKPKNNNNKENKIINNNSNNNKIDNSDIKKQKNRTEKANISSSKKNNYNNKSSKSIYDSPIVNKNSEDDLVTSFEKKPSELKSPETVSEDSFITDEEEIINKKNSTSKKEKEKQKQTDINNNIEKENKKEINVEKNEKVLIEPENEIVYIDRVKELENANNIIFKKEDKEILTSKNKNKSELNNIKVNIKTTFFNEKDKNNPNKLCISKYLNQSQKVISEKLKTSKEKSFKKNTNKINNKKVYDTNSNKLNGNYIQKSITVKKKQMLNQINLNYIETKYNRNTSKNSKIDVLEPIQELQKNLSNHSLKFYSDKKLNISEIKNKLNNNDKNKINKNLSQFDDKYEDIIFHKKLKIDEESKKEFQKINLKDISSSSNNKNTNISSSLNQTYKDYDIRKKKVRKDKIQFNINNNNETKNDNNTSLNNNIKLIKDNKLIKINNDKNKNAKNKPEIHYLKKNTHIVNKSSNKLALSIDDSNAIINNCKKMIINMSGNNIIYAPKKIGMNRVRSHEKTTGNIYSNMSYDPNGVNRIKKINQSNFKNNNEERNTNIGPIYNRKNSDLEMFRFLEKNNSFCGDADNMQLDHQNNLNSLRLNLFNEIPRIYPINSGSFNGNTNVRMNNSLNYYNKTAEKPLGNNSLFMLNRLSSGERITMNNNMQNPNFNRFMNFGININTDFNNYNNMNMFNKSFVNKVNQYPIGYNLGIMSPFNNNINQTNLINLFNNNYLNFNTIQNIASSFINNYNLNDSLYMFPNQNQNNFNSINIEDIIILQEKLKDIIIALNKTKIMANECFEFWNFYYNCSIYCQLEKLFTNPFESNTVRISINYLLFSIMICYDYSFENDILLESYSMLLNLIKINYKNLMIICEHILNKISNESLNNIWVKKLKNIINSYKEIENIQINNMSLVESINYNTNIIIKNLYIILRNYKTKRNDCLSNFVNILIEETYEQINIFFRDYILRTNNLNGSILASVYLRNNSNFSTLPSPYVRTKNNKEFSLVLDLDETLVHFKEKMEGEVGGILRIRPGLKEFLDEVGKYYELIIFTTATQDYADSLIDAIEEDKIYFDHRLYRGHAVIIDNDFVKDLNRIGRPLDKIIIVDNMPQNFRLQKDNGIMIKAFWGEENYDRALFDLIKILVNIAKEGGDLRKGLEKYKDEILKKVSLSIS